MSVMPSKVGADPRKIGLLVGLVAVAVFVYFYNRDSGGGSVYAGCQPHAGFLGDSAGNGSPVDDTARYSRAPAALVSSGRP